MRDVILALDYPEFYLHDVEGLKIILSAYHNAVNAVRTLLSIVYIYCVCHDTVCVQSS